MAKNTQNIGAYHLADHPALYNPARSNNFQFEVDLDASLLKAGVSEDLADAGDYISNGRETLRLAVSKASVPHFKQNTIEINRGNTKAYFAGTYEFDEGSIVVDDYIGADTKSILMAWQRLSGDVLTETVGNAADYKKNATLYEYTPDFSTLVRMWHLKGCWITSIEESDFEWSSGDKRQITVNFRYDRAIPEIITEVAE